MTAPTDGKQERKADAGIGCVLILLVVNTVLMGLFALSFALGPYSSWQQELWYRYGSIGFFLAGSVLPAIAVFWGRRSPAVLLATVSWLLLALLVFIGYAMVSGGGV